MSGPDPCGARRFAGQVALVTGASRGIGLGIARRLVAEGARVSLTARKPDPLVEAASTLGGPEVALAIPGKADDPEHQQAAVEATLERFGRLDVLVTNTGINPVYGPTLDADRGVIRKILDVNVLAAGEWARAARAAWMGANGGSVVTVSSVAGLRPAQGLGWYGVSKAALIALTAQLASELAPSIRVNAVAPAVVRTRFAETLYAGHEEEAADRYPLGRLGDPEDVAAAVAYLASADAAWVTGQTLVLDGGMGLTGGL